MKRVLYVLFCSAVLLATISVAQQTAQPPPAGRAPYQTPPTFPHGSENPEKQFPPDTKAPPPQTLTSAQVEEEIMQHLSSEPGLGNTNVKARVDDRVIVLTGNVVTEVQHELALRIAQSYAGDRSVVDRISIQEQT
jgi:BON domain